MIGDCAKRSGLPKPSHRAPPLSPSSRGSGTVIAGRERRASVPTTRRPTSPRTSRNRTTQRANGKQASSPTRGPDLDLAIVTITPELAQEWLDRGGNNRKVTRRRIEAMTAAIQRGEWQLTGEAIKLDDEGRVRDGQNRLHAIGEAGIPVLSLVAPGVTRHAFDVMDT